MPIPDPRTADLFALASPPCHDCGAPVERVEMPWHLDEDSRWRPGPSSWSARGASRAGRAAGMSIGRFRARRARSPRWTTSGSPTAWRHSPRCSSSPMRTRTRRAPTDAPPTRSAAAPVPVPELIRNGRVRELRGIGRGIEARLRELVETGEIAELTELERELAPGLVGLGRYLGLTARRSVDIAQALGVRTPEEFRAAVAAGRLRTVPGIGPKTEAQIARGARSRVRAAAPARPAAQPGVGARRWDRGAPRGRGRGRRATVAGLV